MTPAYLCGLLAFGIAVGLFSGIMGLGGGALMIPVMVLVFGFSQTKAHGMSLAVMILPVTLPAVYAYYQKGALKPEDLWMALVIAIGFASASYFGGKWAASLPKDELKLVFGFMLMYVAAYTVFSTRGDTHILRSVVLAAVLAGVVAGMYAVTKWMDSPDAPEVSAITEKSPGA